MDEFRFSPRPNRASEIRWRPWGPGAFTEAKLSARPVLLAISAVWCHWCHVMDETTYSDPEVIHLVNERYVPIRVDNDKRPDVNRRYNLGGWPTTAFLTPEGEVITGGTYIPPGVMRQYLLQVADLYRDRRAEIEQRVAELRLEEAQRARTSTAGPLEWSIVDDVARMIGELYDDEYGGFGREPKFPQSQLLRFLLDEHRRRRDERTAQMLRATLDAMARGGLYDHVEDGFFRYATKRDWTVPHYEKMLEDNAELLAVYAEAARTFPDAEYERVTSGVARWMTAALWRPDAGLFGGSQDADEAYYARDAAGRAASSAPFVDPVLYANWNALAASGLVAAGDVARAGAVLASLRTRLWDDAVGTYHFDAGEGPRLPTLLTDLAALLAAELDLYEAGAGGTALAFAERVATRLLALEDVERGGFMDAPPREEPGRVAKTDRPIEDNARAADALLRLETITGEARWREAALRALRAFTVEYREWGQFAAAYARVIARALTEPLHVAVAGTGAGAGALWREVLACDDPALVRERLDPSTDRARMEARGYEPSRVAAYLCVGAACLEPIDDPARLREELGRAGERFRVGTAR